MHSSHRMGEFTGHTCTTSHHRRKTSCWLQWGIYLMRWRQKSTKLLQSTWYTQSCLFLADTCNIFVSWSAAELPETSLGLVQQPQARIDAPLMLISTDWLPSGEPHWDCQAHKPFGKRIYLFKKHILVDKKMSCGSKWDFPLEVPVVSQLNWAFLPPTGLNPPSSLSFSQSPMSSMLFPPSPEHLLHQPGSPS